MSEITRTEKFLRACIDGEPCALKPLTRVEKLLAELNDKLAGGPSEVVILPETVMTVNDEGTALITEPLQKTVAAGDTLSIVYNGTAYECTGVSAEDSIVFGNIEALGLEGGNPNAPFVVGILKNGEDLDGDGAIDFYGMVMPMDGATSVTLSIVQVGAASGGGSASAGGGFIVKATIGEIDPEVMSADCTFDKTFEETLAAIKAGQYVACHAMVEGMCIFRAVSYEETAISFSITMGQTEMQIIMRARGGGSFIIQGE